MEKMTVKAQLDQLADVLGFLDESLEAHDCPMKAMLALDVAVEEVFVNIAHYAYPDTVGDALIEIDYPGDGHCVRVRLSDTGMPYNPLEQDDPDITLSAEERSIGGLGIYMVKKSMDEVTYAYENGRNVLMLEKRF